MASIDRVKISEEFDVGRFERYIVHPNPSVFYFTRVVEYFDPQRANEQIWGYIDETSERWKPLVLEKINGYAQKLCKILGVKIDVFAESLDSLSDLSDILHKGELTSILKTSTDNKIERFPLSFDPDIAIPRQYALARTSREQSDRLAKGFSKLLAAMSGEVEYEYPTMGGGKTVEVVLKRKDIENFLSEMPAKYYCVDPGALFQCWIGCKLLSDNLQKVITEIESK